MGSLAIPKWIGPAITPIVLILLIAAVCFYYCYWKPRREKKKQANKAEDVRENKQVNSPTTYRYSNINPGLANHERKYTSIDVDEQALPYGSEFCDYDTFTTYGPYFMDYCQLPSSSLSYCINYDSRPKFVYYPNTSRHAVSRETTSESRYKGTEMIWKYRVKCPRGECLKCPDLPMIKEGDSIPSLCEEEEDKLENTCEGWVCNCHDDAEQLVSGDEKQEVENINVDNDPKFCQESNNSQSHRDSGYEDQEL